MELSPILNGAGSYFYGPVMGLNTRLFPAAPGTKQSSQLANWRSPIPGRNWVKNLR